MSTFHNHPRSPTRTVWVAVLVSGLTFGCGESNGEPSTAMPDTSGGSGGSAGSAGNAGGSGTGTSGGSGGSAGSTGSAGSGGKGTPAMGTDCGVGTRGATEGRPQQCVSDGVCNALVPRGSYAPAGTPPNFPTGEIVDIYPPIPAGDGAAALTMTIDPNNTAVLYVGVEASIGDPTNNGLWRSRDGGSTWTLLRSGDDETGYDCTTPYLDLPIKVEVDPRDSNHLYVTSGVRGGSNGFWVSWDAGETWKRARDGDLTAMSVDPCDFCHVLVGSHDLEPIGVLETTDGGYTWIEHPPPAGQGWGGGSYGVNFLHDPRTNQGNGQTWLVHNEAMWRTEDAGGQWSRVSDIAGIHGFTSIYYSSTGLLYSGAYGSPGLSTDNGLTWEAISSLPGGAVYYGLMGDGTNVYAMADGFPPSTGLMAAPESNGRDFAPYGSGQTIERGMQHPHFDPHSGILYFVNNAKIYGVRVAEPI